MPTTNFTTGTLLQADWCNEVDAAVFETLPATITSINNKQDHSANLDEYAAVNPTAAGLALLDDATASDQLTTLGVSTYMKGLLDDADEATLKASINLEPGVDVQAYDADTAKLDVAQSWTAQQTPKNSTGLAVTATGTFTFDPTTYGQIQLVTFTNTQTCTFGAPTNIIVNTVYTLILKAGDTSVRTFAWNSAYKFPSATPPITTGTITANAYDIITFIGAASNTLIYIGSQQDVR